MRGSNSFRSFQFEPAPNGPAVTAIDFRPPLSLSPYSRSALNYYSLYIKDKELYTATLSLSLTILPVHAWLSSLTCSTQLACLSLESELKQEDFTPSFIGK
jgi:hypothetical protein